MPDGLELAHGSSPADPDTDNDGYDDYQEPLLGGNPRVFDAFLPDGGPHRRFETLWWESGRYLELVVQTADQPLTIERVALRETALPGLAVEVRHADGRKCGRCWTWSPAVGRDPEHPALCERCVPIIRAGAGG